MMKDVYNKVPGEINGEAWIREQCPFSCHWCCRDWGPFECTEDGCPGGGTVSCAQMADGKYCDTTFKNLYNDLPMGLRANATAGEACRVSCNKCDELKVRL